MPMTSLHTFLLSVACMVGGVVLLALGKSEAIAGTMVAAATAGLVAAKVQDTRNVEQHKKIATENFESTQTLRRQILEQGEEPRA